MSDNPMGLRLSPRLERILNDVQQGIQPSLKDTEFLIDESARFETIASHVRTDDFKIEDTILDDSYDIKYVLGDLITELENIYAHHIGRGDVYIYELGQFNPNTEYNIEKSNPERVESEVRMALRQVRDLQDSFTKNGDKWEVKAYFKHLKSLYGLDLQVTAETKSEDIIPVIMDKVVTVITEEAKKKQEAVDRLKGLTSKKY